MILLDGKLTEDDRLDPAKHKFIGTFRYPVPNTCAYFVCPCHSILRAQPEVIAHWQSGHMDIPQYASISTTDETQH